MSDAEAPIIGIDIGGTKCALSTLNNGRVVEVERFATGSPGETLPRIYGWLENHTDPETPPKIGISCGGPLDESRGLILSPPNLPGWDAVPIVEEIEKRTGGQARLMNDANAGALAEWRFGAGKGARHLVFLTCGTGFGAGLVLNGQIYSGANGNAGEIGHVRLSPEGPVGYGKAGSAEGWCSGGGLTQYAQAHAAALRKALSLPEGTDIVARHVGEAAALGCPEALELLTTFGQRLGQTLSILIDLLNLDTIVIGSIFVRCESWLRPPMEAVIAQEALPQNAAACRIVPAALGEAIGNYAAIAAAPE